MKVRIKFTVDYITYIDDEYKEATMKARHLETEEDYIKYRKQFFVNQEMLDYLIENFYAKSLEVKDVSIVKVKE